MKRSVNGLEATPTWNLRSKRRKDAANTQEQCDKNTEEKEVTKVENEQKVQVKEGTGPISKNKEQKKRVLSVDKKEEHKVPKLVNTNENDKINLVNKANVSDSVNEKEENDITVPKDEKMLVSVQKPEEDVIYVKKENDNDISIINAVKDGCSAYNNEEKPVAELSKTETMDPPATENKEQKVHVKDESLLINDGNVEKVNVSATLKALKSLEKINTRKLNKDKVKLSQADKKKHFNNRLHKFLAPKNALMFLHELKPGCNIKVKNPEEPNSSRFLAQVEYNNTVLGIGRGDSKISAKNAAAECAVKSLISKVLSNKFSNPQILNNRTNETVTLDTEESLGTLDNIPWTGLASYAISKLLKEWEIDMSQIEKSPHEKNQIKKATPVKTPTPKKELPPNAEKLHPSLLLNYMRPGLISEEVERLSTSSGVQVTMRYRIDGKLFVGKGGNKKEARREAAKSALLDLYNMKYPA